MRISHKASLSILLALTLSSCQSLQSEATNQSTGALLGGIAGGLLGAQVGEGKGRVAAAAIGAAIGALAGSAVGAKLDERSTGLASNAVKTSYTAPLGTQITWSNPNNSAAPARGTVVPIRDGKDASGAYCREFQQTIIVGQEKQSAYGTACRQPDGQWKII
ncbi:MAG: RT0821/Lpp0805 family surface protein [Alphaproteobacteria bacterium]